jgi:hypothetical protein
LAISSLAAMTPPIADSPLSTTEIAQVMGGVVDPRF